jgi:hypothetical protein
VDGVGQWTVDSGQSDRPATAGVAARAVTVCSVSRAVEVPSDALSAVGLTAVHVLPSTVGDARLDPPELPVRLSVDFIRQRLVVLYHDDPFSIDSRC